MARKAPGPFVALDAFIMDDPRVENLPWDMRAYFVAIACRVRQLRSDGYLTDSQASRIGYPKWRQALDRFAQVGLVEQVADPDGRTAWYVPAYLKWNPEELEYVRRSKEGTAGSCQRWHDDGCTKPECAEARRWLSAHPT